MPRNSSGNYVLPAGNPVVSDTLIQTTWANPTMSDIGAALTDSLDRNGRGGMLAPFKITDGTVGQPGLSFLSESSTGVYRASPQVLGFSVFGSAVAQMTPTAVSFGAAGMFSVALATGTLTLRNIAATGGTYPQFTGDVPAGGQVGFAGTRAGKLHWAIVMPDTAPESGGNAGGNFGIYRYDDAGAAIGAGPALSIVRATGIVGISQDLGIAGGLTVTGSVNCGASINATGGVSTAADLTCTTDGKGLRFNPNSNAILCTSSIMQFYTGGGQRMTINASGAVSLGGSLTAGSLSSVNDVQAGDSHWLYWGAGTTRIVGDSSASAISLVTGGAVRLALSNAGAVVTGTLTTSGGGIVSAGSVIVTAGAITLPDNSPVYWGAATSYINTSSASNVISLVTGNTIRLQVVNTGISINGDCTASGDFVTAANKGPRWAGGTAILGSASTIDFYASNQRRLGIDSGGNMLLIAGEAYKSVGGPWVAISDERIKENITDYTRGLEAVIALRPVTYTFKPDTKQDTSKVHHGLIAQEVQPVMPEMILPADETFKDTPYAGVAATVPEGGPLLLLDATALTYALCNAARELSDLIEALDVRLTNLEGAI